MLTSLLSLGQVYEKIFTKEITESDVFHQKYLVTDKFRWLENTSSPETKDWIDQQTKLSTRYLSKAVKKTNSFNLIDRYAFTHYDNPRKMGNYYFRYAFYNNYGVPALFYQSSLDRDPEILVDPSVISQKDQITLNGYAVSKDSKLLAYQFSRNGSDWNEVKVISLKTGKHKDDHLTGLKFSHIEWLENGFFYTTYAQEGQFGKTHEQRVFYHKIGTGQQQDQLIFERKNSSSVDFDYLTTSDERFFVLVEKNDEKGMINIFYIDYQSEIPGMKPLITNLVKYDINILDSHDGKFIGTASTKAENESIVEIDPEKPLKWRAIGYDFSDAYLQKVIPFADRLIAVYQVNQQPNIIVYDYSGEMLYKSEMPVASSVGGFSGNYNDEELLFNFTSYTIPPVVYSFNIKTFKKELTKQTTVNFDFSTIEYKEVEYLSKDSVKVPMILVYEKGLKPDGNNPAILKAYGGFSVVSPPSFDPGIVYFIKNGGIFAFANIRGGGDKGVKWARDGRGRNKQNSLDDFIAAAEFLIREKYTCSEKLGATGASNGGLVVAAAAIQRPDLFKAVVPVVAPLDMLRFEKFTVGHWWTDEYGTVADSSSFKNLLHYSPYQNVREEINYPAMLIVTSENDDRVPPFNSYKFVARLQNRNAQVNPILLKIEMESGHRGASTFMSVIKEQADIYGFIMNELMIK
jgi:prolyl oligopeptidase